MFEDRWYQIKAEKATFKYLDRNPDKHPLIALPTGSGKGAIMVRIGNAILEKSLDNNILVLSHEANILKQNYNNMLHLKEGPPTCMYSAGYNSKDIGPVTIAGIQSAYRYPELFEKFNWVLIDEAHTIPMSDTSMYRQFLNGIGEHTRIGLTATPYRLGEGYIIGEDHLFDKIVIDYTTGAKYTRLVDEGFLCPLIMSNTSITMDTTNIKMKGYDFDLKQMSKAFDRESITNSILDDMIVRGAERNKWLIFAIDTEHANHICEGLISRNIPSMIVHSKMPFSKEFVLNQHKMGIIKAVVSVGMLTTGYDDPSIDLIGLLRPTKSPNLHVQMPGRGQRIHSSKDNCLVLDYAGNTKRLGPINKIKPKKKGKGEKGGAPITKDCPVCDTILAPIIKICPMCGYEFAFKSNLELEASTEEIIGYDNKWYTVQDVEYKIHTKPGMPKSIKVTYYCGIRSFNEYIMPDHKGYAGHKSLERLKHSGIIHEDIESTFKKMPDYFLVPNKILIDSGGRYPNIIDYFYEK